MVALTRLNVTLYVHCDAGTVHLAVCSVEGLLEEERNPNSNPQLRTVISVM